MRPAVRLAILAPLRHRDFRLLFIGQAVSVVGNQVYAVALPFQILALGGSPLQLGVGFTVFAGAQLVTILFGGALVDRFPRRRVILTMDFLSAFVVALVAVLGLTHRLQIPYLYVLSAFFGATFSFYTPALSAIMPELIPADALVPGNALRGLSTQSARVVGPLVGGLIVTALGAPIAFAVDAATFAFAFGVFWFSRQLAREPQARKPLLREIRDGVDYTFSVTWIWLSIVGFAATNGFFFAGFTVAMPILVFSVLKGTALTYGLINAVAAVGELTGGLLVGNVHFKRLLVGTYVFSSLLGIAFTVIGLAPVLVVVMAGGFLFNLCLVLSNTHWDSALQTYVPSRLLGRVTSIDFFGSYLVGPIAPVAAAAVLLRVGPGPIFVVGGLIAAVYWVVAMALVRPDRRALDRAARAE
ncbi:MAG TPA: MFS transporter [Candidatus Dormibacteraeota bacterium]|nr:MFS transporter [Candidatus Dormibacteraeota bacterium]